METLVYQWLLAGVLLVALEALGLPGLGFLFAGLGAITVAASLEFSLLAPEAQLAHWLLFSVSTAVWGALLWVPLKRFRAGKRTGGYSNMVGETAFIGGEGLIKGALGEVTWSGTIMKAKLIDDAAVDKLDGGSQVQIVAVQGNTLIVKPKK